MILTHYFSSQEHNILQKNEILTTTITEYPIEQQYTISKILAQGSGRALRRFDNFDKYIYKRQQTEKWLYTSFKSMGGKPNTMFPYYFIVGENEQLKQDFGTYASSIQIDTDIISAYHLSFTIGDSMAIYFSNIPKQIYLIDQITKLIENDELVNEQLSSLKPYHRYIEAQLWNKDYIKKR